MKRAVRRVKKAPMNDTPFIPPGALEVLLPIVVIAALIFAGMMLGDLLSYKPYVATDCSSLRKEALRDFEDADSIEELNVVAQKHNMAMQVCNQEAP